MINIRELTETFSVSNLKWNRLPSWNPPLPPSLSWNGCWIGLLKVLMHTMSLLLLSLYGPSQQNNSSSPPMKQQKWVHTISFTERIILILKKKQLLLHRRDSCTRKYCSDVSYWFFPGASSSFVQHQLGFVVHVNNDNQVKHIIKYLATVSSVKDTFVIVLGDIRYLWHRQSVSSTALSCQNIFHKFSQQPCLLLFESESLGRINCSSI